MSGAPLELWVVVSPERHILLGTVAKTRGGATAGFFGWHQFEEAGWRVVRLLEAPARDPDPPKETA